MYGSDVMDHPSLPGCPIFWLRPYGQTVVVQGSDLTGEPLSRAVTSIAHRGHDDPFGTRRKLVVFDLVWLQ